MRKRAVLATVVAVALVACGVCLAIWQPWNVGETHDSASEDSDVFYTEKGAFAAGKVLIRFEKGVTLERMHEIVEQGDGEWSVDFHDAEGNVIGASVYVRRGEEERVAEDYQKVEGVESCELMSVYSYHAGATGEREDAVREVYFGEYNPEIAIYSNTSSETDICAYGTSIEVLQSSPFPFLSYIKTEMSGTSFAAPQVAAAAALLKAQNPDWDADEIESRLFSTTRLPEDFVDANDGHGGAPDGRDDDGRYGYGTLDAAAAVGWSEPSAASPATGGSLAALYAQQEEGAR